jgi:hypothetical protein
MTSREFCYWLQGFFEISGADITKKLSEKQVDIVRRHLAMVFKHEIDPSQGTPEHQAELTAIHHGSGSGSELPTPPVRSSSGGFNPTGGGPLINC